MEENPIVGLLDIPLGDLPLAKLAAILDEVLVKQEWIELCKKWRLPIKQKYQLHFRVAMWLKIKFRRLRR